MLSGLLCRLKHRCTDCNEPFVVDRDGHKLTTNLSANRWNNDNAHYTNNCNRMCVMCNYVLQDDVLAGIIEGINKMGKQNELIYSDDEGSLNSHVIKEYIENQNRNTQNPNTSSIRGKVHAHV